MLRESRHARTADAAIPGEFPAPPKELEQRFGEAFTALEVAESRLLVAVSGGADSVALLRLLARWAPDFTLELVVAHVDHGISPQSAVIADDVAKLAQQLGLGVLLERLALGRDATETAARSARWAALDRMRTEAAAEWIVTAHHLDDQAETVLMRVLRGTGPAGLAGMSARGGNILRPLLSFRRDELAQYVRSQGLQYWADPANQDPRHDRAWIRQELMPLLSRRWPHVTSDLTRVGAAAQRWRSAWDGVLGQLPGLDVRLEPDGISVAGGVLADYDSEVGWAVVRAVARRVGAVVSSAGAERVMDLARSGESGHWVPLGSGWRAASAFGRVRFERVSSIPEAMRVLPEPGTVAWGDWTFRLSRAAAPPRQDRRGLTAWFPMAPLAIRSPAAGDRMQPLGGRGHRAIVRLLQDERVPLGRRGRWPVVELAGEPTWVPGICRSQSSLPEPGTEALRIDAVHS